MEDSKDLINRRKAFEYFVTLWECIGTIMDRDEWEDVCMTTANEIPPAQPEPLTDREQRIFLAAMGREEKVCKQVDEECRDCREPYEDSLVSVCREITRKGKGALWTI